MAIIKNVYDSDTGSTRSNTYRFTVENLLDPMFLSLVKLNKDQNKVWRRNVIRARQVNELYYPHKVTSMTRGPRVDAAIQKYGKKYIKDNPRMRRVFDQNLPTEFATSFDIYVMKDHIQFRKMKEWIDSNIRDRKNWLKIEKLKRDIDNIEYYDQILTPSGV